MTNKGLLALAVATFGFAVAAAQTTTAPPKPGEAPGPPRYQMRAAETAANRHATRQDAAAIYSTRCGYCHFAFGMGTNLLTKQQMQAGNPPAMGLLTNRTDLEAAYVALVVRNGKNAMPSQTRVDITDAELTAVAAYLAKGSAK